MSDAKIRQATENDVHGILQIYAHEVLHGLATFEEETPPLEEMRQRMLAIEKQGLPYLVAEFDGTILGYAYANNYRPRPAYRNAVENSVYVAQDAHGRGVGKVLLSALIEQCETAGRRQMVAVIGDSDNKGSIALHAALGFQHIGTLPSVGFKLGRWVDTVIMQRRLGDGDATLPSQIET